MQSDIRDCTAAYALTVIRPNIVIDGRGQHAITGLPGRQPNALFYKSPFLDGLEVKNTHLEGAGALLGSGLWEGVSLDANRIQHINFNQLLDAAYVAITHNHFQHVGDLDASQVGWLMFQNNRVDFGFGFPGRGTIQIGNRADVIGNRFFSSAVGIGDFGDREGESIISHNRTLNCRQSVHIQYAGQTANTWKNNAFLHDLQPAIIDIDSLLTTQRNKRGERIAFDFNVVQLTDSAQTCMDCRVTCRLFPEESDFHCHQDGGHVSGSFTPTQIGLYGLKIEATDAGGNTSIRKLNYIVSETGTLPQRTQRFYMDTGHPTHGQPRNFFQPTHDAQRLLKVPPPGPGEFFCGYWTQSSVDEIPEYPFGVIERIRWVGRYKCRRTGEFLIMRSSPFDPTPQDSAQTSAAYVLPLATAYSAFDLVFDDLNWSMDYPWTWYWIGCHFKSMDGSPSILTDPDLPACLDVTYSFFDGLKSISEPNIVVWQMVYDPSGNGWSTILLENPDDRPSAVNLRLSGLVLSLTNFVTPDGASVAREIDGGRYDQLLVVPVDIRSESGALDVRPVVWSERLRILLETAVDNPGPVHHRLSGLERGRDYGLYVSYAGSVDSDQCAEGACTADQDGEIAFVYTGGFASHPTVMIALYEK
jgi:hypothetical protein